MFRKVAICSPRSASNGLKTLIAALLMLAGAPDAFAQDDAALAKKLANPITSLISIPLQSTYDANIGPEDFGRRLVVTFLFPRLGRAAVALEASRAVAPTSIEAIGRRS